MKLFTQLALITAMATSGSAFALQSMDDSALGETTGQDGLTITIAPPAGGLTINQVVLHDKDGLKGAPGYAAATAGGAIILGTSDAAGVALGSGGTANKFALSSATSQSIVVLIDASGAAAVAGPSTVGTAPVLNIAVTLPSDLVIKTGDIWVAGSGRGAIAVGTTAALTAGNTATTGAPVRVLDTMSIGLGGAVMNIQLGNTPQGAMIKLTGSITGGGLSISNIGLTDQTTGFLGRLGVGQLNVTDNASTTTMTLNAAIGVKPTGLEVSLTTPAGGYDVMMQNVTLGTNAAANSIGDLQLVGVNLNGTKIGIAGH